MMKDIIRFFAVAAVACTALSACTKVTVVEYEEPLTGSWDLETVTVQFNGQQQEGVYSSLLELDGEVDLLQLLFQPNGLCVAKLDGRYCALVYHHGDGRLVIGEQNLSVEMEGPDAFRMVEDLHLIRKYTNWREHYPIKISYAGVDIYSDGRRGYVYEKGDSLVRCFSAKQQKLFFDCATFSLGRAE